MIEQTAGIRLHYGSEPSKSTSKRGEWKKKMIERLKKEAIESRYSLTKKYKSTYLD